MADKKKMSVAEILAAARNADSKGGAPSPKPAAPSAPEETETSPAEPAASVPVSAAESAGAPTAAKPPAQPAAGGPRPNVKDILALARAGKAATAAPAEQPAPKPSTA